MGREEQYILVVPSLDLVVVRQGEAAFATELLKQVIGAIK
jgi:hypothetical protein